MDSLSGLRCIQHLTTNLNKSLLHFAITVAMRSISGNCRHTSRLRFWQEKLWDEFANSYPNELPQSSVGIAKIFGIVIPSQVLHWVHMDDDENYVADLIQLPGGSRYLQPRHQEDEITPHAVFTTCVATGRELRDCQMKSARVTLTNGNKFVMDAHGIWMTIPEAESLLNESRIDDEHPPWVNGMPPQFPPK
ncbi:hypothetical protein OAG68_02820 [bacterium]|nr:hypothetical protein [bacterium]